MLDSDVAVSVSVNIMKAFIEMLKFLMINGQVFERLTSVEHDKKFDEVFNQFQLEENIKQRIFFDGQIYDAYTLIIDIIKKATFYNLFWYYNKNYFSIKFFCDNICKIKNEREYNENKKIYNNIWNCIDYNACKFKSECNDNSFRSTDTEQMTQGQ